MKKVLLIFALCLLFPLMAAAQQEVINHFDSQPADTSFWFFESVASSDTSGVEVTYTNEQVKEGTGSMKIDWTVQASESWGGFTNLMRMSPDSTVFDFSLATHLSLWYYNATPSSQPTTVEFRILLKDVSEVPLDITDITQAEFWYSHHKILDSAPGWNQILMPLKDVGTQSDQGLWLPGWAGAAGNGQLDLDKIKAYKFEFSIDGSLYNAGNPQESGIATGTIFLDQLALVGHRNPVINFFDTTSTATNFEITGTGTSSIVLSDNADNAMEDKSLQMDWTVDADQSWGGFAAIRFDADSFLTDMGSFSHLSLRYNNLVASDQPGNVVFRLQLHEYSEGADQEELWFYETKTVLDSSAGWHQLLIPLNDRGLGVPPNDEGFSNPGWGGVNGNEKLD